MSATTESSPPHQRRWPIILVVGIAVLGFFFVFDPFGLLSNLLSHFGLTHQVEMTLGKLLLIGVPIILLLDFRWRRLNPAWPEIGIFSLIVFTIIILISTFTNSGLPNSTTSAIFNLPANKVQTDLANLQPDNNILTMLVVDHQVYRFYAKLIDVRGVGSEVLTPPYKNKDAITVQISLTRGTNETDNVEFADQLASTNAIFLLPSLSTSPTPTPSSPTPTQIKVSANFFLPITKIQSDLTPIMSNANVVVLLVENHQAYRYDAQVIQKDEVGGTPIPTPNPTSTLQVNNKVSSISISLTDPTDQIIMDFVSQLSDATAIYLLPLQ